MARHVTILDPMRGVAALAVVIFHYLAAILPTLRPNGLEHIVEHGKMGVQVFFVISGFVIPYAMQHGGYVRSDWWRFMLRRIIRIAPPAYIAALAVILFHVIAIMVNGAPVEGDPFPGLGWKAIIANITFTAEYLGVNWYNFVYWSLTAEFEFYLVMALILPWIATGSPTWRVTVIMALLIGTRYFPVTKFFDYVEYFVLGMLVFLWRETTMDKRITLCLAVAVVALCFIDGLALPACVSLAAALVIASGTNMRSRATDFLGEISYSLYITHVPVAYFAETALKRVVPIHDSLPGKAVMFMTYLGLALGVAYVFHLMFERPFLRLSKKVKQHPRPAG